MADQGLEDALLAAIAHEVQDGTVTSPDGMVVSPGGTVVFPGGADTAVPLLHLVQQLLGNATGKQLSSLKEVRPY